MTSIFKRLTTRDQHGDSPLSLAAFAAFFIVTFLWLGDLPNLKEIFDAIL